MWTWKAWRPGAGGTSRPCKTTSRVCRAGWAPRWKLRKGHCAAWSTSPRSSPWRCRASACPWPWTSRTLSTARPPPTSASARRLVRQNPGKQEKKEGLDPTMLGRLMYEPKQVSFQGSNFERSQLCALREKVIHSAQEMLLQGPAMPSSPRRRKLMDSAATAAAPIVPGALGVNAELPPMGRRSAQGGVSRPGSRGQPSARGSPQPDRGDGPGSGMGQELGIAGVHADSTRMEGTHLPALTAAAY
mmetsp:Transcript_72935/g.235848  ORF Transcript_72935/g.235848 Transcript_72935/m.235848 type:complete len:245 (-) Transcript_72935:94-828(-)